MSISIPRTISTRGGRRWLSTSRRLPSTKMIDVCVYVIHKLKRLYFFRFTFFPYAFLFFLPCDKLRHKKYGWNMYLCLCMNKKSSVKIMQTFVKWMLNQNGKRKRIKICLRKLWDEKRRENEKYEGASRSNFHMHCRHKSHTHTHKQQIALTRALVWVSFR